MAQTLWDEEADMDGKVDIRLPGKGNTNSHGARPVHLIITMMKRIRTSRLPIKTSLSTAGTAVAQTLWDEEADMDGATVSSGHKPLNAEP